MCGCAKSARCSCVPATRRSAIRRSFRPRGSRACCAVIARTTSPGASDVLDFADVRGIVEELLDGLGYVIAPAAGHKADDQAAGREVLIRPASADKQPFLHPGLGAVVLSSSRMDADGSPALVGYFGEVHPELRKRLDLQHPALPALPVFGFEIDIPAFRRPVGARITSRRASPAPRAICRS